MFRRSVVGAVVAFCLGALLTPAATAVAAGVGTVSLDTVTTGPYSQGYARTQTDKAITASSVLSDGTVSLVLDSGSYLTIKLSGGAPLQAGSTYPVGGVNKLTGTCAQSAYGELRVDAVEYSGATLAVLAAAYGVPCSGGGWQAGSIRIASSIPEPQVHPAPATAPSVALSTPSAFSVDVVNTGSIATGTLGAAAPDATIAGSADFTVTSDGCVGRVLTPAATCRLGLSFERATGGSSKTLVKVTDALAPGGHWVVPVSGTAVAPPDAPIQVRPFPAVGGGGVTWGRPTTGYLPTGYRVVRSVAGSSWSDVSGPLPVDARSWVDVSLAPGAAADYRVQGENLGGLGAPSTTVTAARPRQDPVVGAIDAVTVDVDAGSGSAYPGLTDAVTRDVVAEPVSNTDAVPETRTLRGQGVDVTIPYVLPGPGVYPLTGVWAPRSVYQGSSWVCGEGSGSLTVRELAYDASLQVTTLSATYRLECNTPSRPDLVGPAFGELRIKSTEGFAALTVAPSKTQLGRVPVGAVSPRVPVTVTNTGLTDQALGGRSLTGDGARSWRIADDACPGVLAAGASCTVQIEAAPTSSGSQPVQLVVPDETARASHHAAGDVVGTSLPTAATSVSALRLPSGGVDLSWSPPTDWGGTGAVEYVIYRASDAGTDRFTIPFSATPAWSDVSPPAHSTYAVALVTEIGEGPASAAAAPVNVADYFVSNTSSTYGQPQYLGMVATPGGTTAVLFPAKVWGAGLAMSPDGRTLLSSQAADGGYSLWRQPLDGSSPPTRLWTASSVRLGRPSWSPDGTRVAVGSVADSGGAETLHVLPAAGGSPTLSVAGISEPTWLPDARTIVAHDATGVTAALLKIDASTGRRLGTIPGTDGARMPTISPDGRWIAFRRYDATGASSTFVVPATGGTALQAPNQVGFSDVTWSPDGSSLRAVLKPYYGFDGIYEIPVSGSGTPGEATPLSLRVRALFDGIAWGGGRAAIAPSPALTGRQATFRVDTSGLAAGVTLTCSVDQGAATACSSTFTTPTLTTGIHTVRVRSVEPGGRATVAARTFAADATAPAVSITALPLAVLGTAVTVRYSAGDTGGGTVASYDLRYRYASPAGGFTAYAQPAGWQGMRTRSLALTLSKGYTYCFSVRARDSLGNLSGWTSETCTRVALDDRALTGTGWTRGTGTAYVFGTYSGAAASGRVLSAKVSARQIGVVVTTCSTCGGVDVRLAGVYLGRKSLASSTTKYRQILWLPYGAYRSGTLTITTVGSKRVLIDAVVIRK